MSTVNSLTIPISVISNTRDKNLAHRIVSGDSGAYTILITWTDIATISGTVQLYFVLGDGTYATRDSSDGVVLLNNTVTYTLEEALYSVAGNLTCYVQFLNSNLFTPLKLTFSGIQIPAGTTLVAPVIAYPAWVTSVASAEALRVIAESNRVIAEGSRVSVEGLRVTAENSRVSVEGNRVTAEGLRVTAEGNRVIAEGSRVTAEGLRVTAEGNRVIAESGRNSSYVIAEAARDDLYDAAEAVRNIFEAFDSGNYTAGNKVSYLGSSYVCTVTTTAGELPTDTNYWLLIASAGDLVQADLDARVNPIEAQQIMQDDIDLGNLSDAITQTAMISRTGTGTKNGIALTNPISFKDSGARVEEQGLSIRDIIVNGNFTDDSSWTPTGGTESVASNTYSLTGDGSSAGPRTATTIAARIVGHVYWIRYKVRVTNSDCSSIKTYFDEGLHTVVSTPTINTWYTESYIRTATGVSTSMHIYVYYADVGTANTKVMEIKEVECIDLTAHYGASNEPTAAQMDLIAPAWFDGTVNVVNPNLRTQNATDTIHSDLSYTGTLRSVVDTGVIYRDRLYNSLGKWYVDRYVNPADGLKQAMATENATVTGKPYVYRDGTTSIETSVIAPLVDMKIPYADVNNTYVPTLTWTTATPTITTSSFRYAHKAGRCMLKGQCVMSNGGGATNLTITLPAPVRVGSGQSIVCLQLKINATWSAPIVQIIESTNLVTFKVPFALTNGQAAEFEFYAEYEVA